MNINTIPAELRQDPHWVVWGWVVREGKRTKPPLDPMTGVPGDATDARLWMTFERACGFVREKRYAGVGFAVTTDSPYSGVDLDGCVLEDGSIEPGAMAIVQRLDSYTEITPSGHGLRVWVKGKLPPGGRRKGKIELYDAKRYFTITGHLLPGFPQTINERQEELNALHTELFPPETKPLAKRSAEPLVDSDQDLLQRMFSSRNGHKIRALFDGDRGGYASESESDLALCSHLAWWCGGVVDAVDHLFRQSGLMRPKWDRDDYRERTLVKACQQSSFYDPNREFQGSHIRNGTPGSPNHAAPKRAAPLTPHKLHASHNTESMQAYTDAQLGVTYLSTVEVIPMCWLWQDRIPMGKLTLIAGEGGIGKSFMTMSLAAIVSRGGTWPDRPDECAEASDVITMSAEDDLADTVVPRLISMGADLSRIVSLGTAILPNGTRSPVTLGDIVRLEEVLRRLDNPRLMIVDPLPAFIGLGIDDHKNAEIRSILGPLAEFAAKHRIAILGITHFNKSPNTKAINRIIGSVAYTNAARATWCVVLDPNNDKRRLMLPAKHNLTENHTGMAYTITDGIVVWEEDPINDRLSDVLDGEAAPRTPKLEKAIVWLTEFLSAGPKSSDDVKAAAKVEGFGRIIWEAKDAIGIKARKTSMDGGWVWDLPLDLYLSKGAKDAKIDDW